MPDPVPPLSPQIDHVVINVMAGLDEAAERYQRLGFQLTTRGHHTLGTSNHLAIFGTNYLELLGFEPGNEQKRPDLVHTPPGLSGLVFKPPADPGFAEALQARGVPTEPPRTFSRPVSLPDGSSADARFRTTTLPGAVANGRVFFCHQETPDLVWRDEWRQHPNRVTGLATFVIAASDPARSAAVFGRMFGDDALQPIEGGVALDAGDVRVLLLTPDAVARRYGDAAPRQADGTDRMVVLGLRTASLDAARSALQAGGMTAGDHEGRLVVPATEACGLALTFEA